MESKVYLLSVFFLLASCANEKKISVWEDLATPEMTNGQIPNISVSPNGTPVISWVENNEKVSTLFSSKFINEKWTEPTVVAKGSDWFINWADFPKVCPLSNDTYSAHFLKKTPGDWHSYSIYQTFSKDSGKTWMEPKRLHNDSTETEHGFVSSVYGNGEFVLAWLDGRNYGDSTKEDAMSFRTATFDNKGVKTEDYLLDDRTCDCCQTTGVMADNGPVFFYRDRSESELRDISYVRKVDGVWESPKKLAFDGWVIEGCPVNGPSAAARGNNITVAWFTAPDGMGAVKTAFSSDGGETFTKPMEVSTDETHGRVGTILTKENVSWIIWLQMVGNQTKWVVRGVNKEGKMTKIIPVGNAVTSRTGGFPSLIEKGNEIWACFYLPDEGINILKMKKPLL
ncbi:MAG: hypothetical protein ACJATA_001239 [Sphingobacteriales bacterium]|jgi:hypothetical protein